MKPHLPLNLLRSVVLAATAFFSVSASSAETFVVEGVNINNAAESARFYDTGKGCYIYAEYDEVEGVLYYNSLFNKFIKLRQSTGSFDFMGDLKKYVVNPSAPLTIKNQAAFFTELNQDGNTCWYQASSNMLQYWLDSYGVFYKGENPLPYGFTYDKKYLSELGGTLSLNVTMFMDDSFNDAGALYRTAFSWFMLGTNISPDWVKFEPNAPEGGFFAACSILLARLAGDEGVEFRTGHVAEM